MKIVIWGTGKEALAAATLLKKFMPAQALTFLDDNSVSATNIDGSPVITGKENVATALSTADLIVKSPGISLYDPRIEGRNVTSLMNLWFEEKPDATTICISGSKGKSTTSSLLTHVLNKLGKIAVLVGNIGTPLTEAEGIEADYIVIEVSSYQAANFNAQCDIALVTTLYPEHLDWHGSLAQYYHDKLNLLAHADIKFIGSQAFKTASSMDLSMPGDVRIVQEARGKPGNAYLERPHNLANIDAILAVTDHLGLNTQEVLSAMADFTGLPHRQNELGTKDGILYVDDSISTTVESAIAAMEVYKDKPIALICGGFDRGLDYEGLATYIKDHGIKAVCMGPSGLRIHDLVPHALHTSDMAEAVKAAKTLLPQGGVILLSPAAPSYGLFKDFKERGAAFKQAALG